MIDLALIAQTLTSAPIVGEPGDLQAEIAKLILGAVAALLGLIIQEIRVRLQRAAAERAKAVASAMAAGVEALPADIAATTKRVIKITSERLAVAEDVHKIVEATVHKEKPHTRTVIPVVDEEGRSRS